jgi:hypothetical protein
MAEPFEKINAAPMPWTILNMISCSPVEEMQQRPEPIVKSANPRL